MHTQRQAQPEPRAGPSFFCSSCISIIITPLSLTTPSVRLYLSLTLDLSIFICFIILPCITTPSAPGSPLLPFLSCSPFTLSLTLNPTFLSPFLFYSTFLLFWFEPHAERDIHVYHSILLFYYIVSLTQHVIHDGCILLLFYYFTFITPCTCN